MERTHKVVLNGKEVNLLEYLLRTTRNLLGNKFGTATGMDLKPDVDEILDKVSKIGLKKFSAKNEIALEGKEIALIRACADAFAELITEMRETLEVEEAMPTLARNVTESQSDLIAEIQCLVIHLMLEQVGIGSSILDRLSDNDLF